MATEDPTNASLLMDRGLPLGNSEDVDLRRALHVKVKNKGTEPIPITGTISVSAGGLTGVGSQAELTIGTSAVKVQAGGSPLADRKLVTVQPRNRSVYFGFNSSVTASTGTEVFKNQTFSFDVTVTGEVWIVAALAGTLVRVGEGV